MRRIPSLLRRCGAVLLAALLLAPAVVSAVELKQAAFVPEAQAYRFGAGGSIPSIPIQGAPADTDWRRWAMLHDGSSFRVLAFRSGASDLLYQFVFDPGAGAYVFGHQAQARVAVQGAPQGADPTDFAMLHDGQVYRLYMRDRQDPRRLHQFGFDVDRGAYVYGHLSAPVLPLTGFRADADLGRWAMLHDGTNYRIFTFAAGRSDVLFQGAWDAAARAYVWGHQSTPTLRLEGAPADAIRGGAAMLHDGTAYRFYFLGE